MGDRGAAERGRRGCRGRHAVDDVQWAPPSVTSVLDEIAARTEAPVVQLLTTLPEQAEGLVSSVSGSVVRVGPIEDEEAKALVEAIAGSIEAAVRDRIVDLADGHPLFLIETLRLIGGPGGSAGATSGPNTIRGVIAARLDHSRCRRCDCLRPPPPSRAAFRSRPLRRSPPTSRRADGCCSPCSSWSEDCSPRSASPPAGGLRLARDGP